MEMKTEQAKILEWMKGNEIAADFIWKMALMTQVADDLVDEDDIDKHHYMTKLLSLCLFEIPQNPFFKQYSDTLTPLLATSFQIWSWTDMWGAGDDPELNLFGYCYREHTEQAMVMAAYLIGGQDHARWVARDMVEFYRGAGSEKFSDWLEEMKDGQ